MEKKKYIKEYQDKWHISSFTIKLCLDKSWECTFLNFKTQNKEKMYYFIIKVFLSFNWCPNMQILELDIYGVRDIILIQ